MQSIVGSSQNRFLRQFYMILTADKCIRALVLSYTCLFSVMNGDYLCTLINEHPNEGMME